MSLSSAARLLLLLSTCYVSLVVCADSASIVCPTAPYDVQYRGYNVTCRLYAQCPSGINSYLATAIQYRDNDNLQLASNVPHPYVYLGGAGQVQNLTADVMFTLLQYSRDGNYTVTAEFNCYSGYYTTYTSLVVANTKNDKAAPIVRSVYIPEIIGANEYTVPVTLTVTDDLAGVKSLYIAVQYYLYQETGGMYTTWEAPMNSSRATNVTINLLLRDYMPGPLRSGVFNLYMRVEDQIGLSRSYSKEDLEMAGLQSTVRIDSTVSVPQLDSLVVPPIVKYGDDLTVLVSSSDPNGVGTVTVKAYRADFLIGYASYDVNVNYTETSLYTELTVQIPKGAPSGFYYVDVTLINKYGASNMYENVNKSLGGSVNSTFAANFTLVKSTCAAGRYRRYSAASSQPCSLCPIGTYSDAGEFRCHACAPGYFSTVNGSSACQPCPAGTTGIGGSWACSPCPVNFFNDQVGQASCQPCAQGSVRSAGESTCRQCWQGTYITKGSSVCSECPAGSYSTDPSIGCIACPAGTYNPYRGYIECWKCPANTFSSGGFSYCTPCDGGKKGPAGSNSKLNCYYD